MFSFVAFSLPQAIRDASALYRRYADDGNHASLSSPSPLSPSSTSSSSTSRHFNLGGLSDSPRRSELQIALLVLLARAYSLVAFTAAAAVAAAAAAETVIGDANSAKHRNRLTASSASAALHAMECECAVLLDAALRQSHARWGAQSPQHVEVCGTLRSCIYCAMNRLFWICQDWCCIKLFESLDLPGLVM